MPGRKSNRPVPPPVAKPVPKPDQDDVLVWPDGTWCYRFELPEMTHLSDDYKTLFVDTPEWAEFVRTS